LVFVYGIACVMNHWHHQAKYFAETHQVILFDLRGHHKSRPVVSDKELTLKGIGKDMIALLDHLEIPKATFIGHSFGVPAILEAHHMAPERFSRIVLINGFARNPIEKMFGLNMVGPTFQFVKKSFKSSPEFWGAMWNELSYNQIAMYLAGALGGFNLKLTAFKDIEIYARGVAKIDLKVFISLFDELMKFDGRKLAKEIKCPTLVIAGDKDQITPMSFQHELQQAIKGSEFFTVPYGSHCSQLDFPEYINLKIKDFLEPKKPKRGSKPAQK
ncbi:MAG: alpha/beta hydrolase, partial [Bdellovibrionota bacterium]